MSTVLATVQYLLRLPTEGWPGWVDHRQCDVNTQHNVLQCAHNWEAYIIHRLRTYLATSPAVSRIPPWALLRSARGYQVTPDRACSSTYQQQVTYIMSFSRYVSLRHVTLNWSYKHLPLPVLLADWRTHWRHSSQRNIATINQSKLYKVV